MKNVIIRILAVLLTVWYSMSVIGFDVHTCNGSGRSFVVTSIKGLTCEDIHPEHTCAKASCCSGEHKECCSAHEEDHVPGHSSCEGISIRAKSCCSSDYQVLALTGTVNHNDHEHFDECSCGNCPCTAFSACDVPLLFAENNSKAYIRCPESGVGSAGERQAALRVWRI